MIERPSWLEQSDSLSVAYETYRQSQQSGWGLAWHLSAELCKRYYCSHGIVPYVSEHSGLGYYGIEVHLRQCAVNGSKVGALGRFTMAGNVENWRTGEPGDHGCVLEERAKRGEPLSHLLRDAIRHLNLPAVPAARHTNCHHKRRGQCFVMLYEVAALVALRYEHRLHIWNHPFHTDHLSERYDSGAQKPGQAEPPDYFLFHRGEHKLLIRGDGRVVLPEASDSLWERYMHGESVGDLARWVAAALQLDHE